MKPHSAIARDDSFFTLPKAKFTARACGDNSNPGVRREAVRPVLRALRKQGLIALTGKGRGAEWQRTDGTLAPFDPHLPEHD